MSFILDALKKSELERQRQSIPGLMDSGTPGARARFPLWAIALVVLLGINLIALLVVLMRSGAPPASALHATAASTAAKIRDALTGLRRRGAGGARGTRNADTQRFSPLDPAPVYAPEIPAVGDPASGEPAGGSAAAGDPTPQPGAPRTNPPQSIRLRVLAARAPVRLTAATRCSRTRTTKPRRRCCPRSANST